MIANGSGRARLLGELRRVEWRRLLLAVALLSAWGRALVPLPAQAAIEAAGAVVLCTLGTATSGAGEDQPDAAHETRACPFCRLADLSEGLPPYVPVIAEVLLGPPADLPLAAARSSVGAMTLRPPARGPPAMATTL